MGGNAFPGKQMSRIHRDDILPLVRRIAETLAVPDLTVAYLMANLMGSAGKQETSGDLDFAINNKPARFVGEPELPVFRLRDVAARVRDVLPADQVRTQTLKGGQFQTIWWVDGRLTGFVQCDFIAGDPEWLRFSHWSPGLDVSPWKGVMISTMLGVLAKMRKDWELVEDTEGRLVAGLADYRSLKEERERRVARIGWHFDLELGLHRKWEFRRQPGQGLSISNADEFETQFGDICPRLPRLGHVTNPEAVLTILFGTPTTLAEVDTFEKIVQRIRETMPDRFEQAKERFLEAFTRSAAQNDYDLDEVAAADVWMGK